MVDALRRRWQSGAVALRGEGVGATLARRSVGVFGVRVLVAATAFGLQAFLTRLLGPEEFGRYIYAVSWILFISQVGVLGLDTASLRFISAYEAQGRWPALHGFVRRSVQFASGLSLVLAAGLLTAVWLLGDRLAPGLARPITIASVLLPLTVLLQLLVSQLQALRRVVLGQGVQGLLRPALIVTGLGALVGLGWSEGTALAAIAMNTAATFVAVLLAWAMLRRVLPGAVLAAAPVFENGAWLGTAVPLFLITAAQLILTQTDVLMLGAMVGTTQAGVYAVASQLSTVITFAIMSLNAILAPMIASLHAQGRRAELQRVLTLSSRGVLAFAVPTVVILAAAGPLVLQVFGSGFAGAYIPLLILSGGQLTIALCGSVGFLLTMTGHERVATAVIGLTALTNIGLNLLLIPRYGLVGAAIATSTATALRSLVLSVYVRRLLGFDATALGFGTRIPEGTL